MFQVFDEYTIEERLWLYGDPAYQGSYGIMGSYRAFANRPVTHIQKKFNRRMSKLRIAVEHGFALHQNLWTFNGFRLGLKIEQSPVAAYYVVAVLLSNIYTCLRGNQTSKQFAMDPPSLEEYLKLED